MSVSKAALSALNLPLSLPPAARGVALPDPHGFQKDLFKGLRDAYWSDDEEDRDCPLCLEEMDISDLNFKPCPCGYQICRFCWHHIKENLNRRCPACRREYTDAGAEFKPVSAEDVKRLDRQKKQKEREKRELETLGRTRLASLRVIQRNVVYVVGWPDRVTDEILPLLRANDYFGQYGRIAKITIAKRPSSAHSVSKDPTVGVYVTYHRKEDAAKAITAVDGTPLGDGRGALRASFGTSRYCTSYLRNQACMDPTCQGLHEPGEEADSFTKEDMATRKHPIKDDHLRLARRPPPTASATASPVISAARRHEEAESSALPRTASWAKPGSGPPATVPFPTPPPPPTQPSQSRRREPKSRAQPAVQPTAQPAFRPRATPQPEPQRRSAAAARKASVEEITPTSSAVPSPVVSSAAPAPAPARTPSEPAPAPAPAPTSVSPTPNHPAPPFTAPPPGLAAPPGLAPPSAPPGLAAPTPPPPGLNGPIAPALEPSPLSPWGGEVDMLTSFKAGGNDFSFSLGADVKEVESAPFAPGILPEAGSSPLASVAHLLGAHDGYAGPSFLDSPTFTTRSSTASPALPPGLGGPSMERSSSIASNGTYYSGAFNPFDDGPSATKPAAASVLDASRSSTPRSSSPFQALSPTMEDAQRRSSRFGFARHKSSSATHVGVAYGLPALGEAPFAAAAQRDLVNDLFQRSQQEQQPYGSWSQSAEPPSTYASPSPSYASAPRQQSAPPPGITPQNVYSPTPSSSGWMSSPPAPQYQTMQAPQSRMAFAHRPAQQQHQAYGQAAYGGAQTAQDIAFHDPAIMSMSQPQQHQQQRAYGYDATPATGFGAPPGISSPFNHLFNETLAAQQQAYQQQHQQQQAYPGAVASPVLRDASPSEPVPELSASEFPPLPTATPTLAPATTAAPAPATEESTSVASLPQSASSSSLVNVIVKTGESALHLPSPRSKAELRAERRAQRQALKKAKAAVTTDESGQASPAVPGSPVATSSAIASSVAGDEHATRAETPMSEAPASPVVKKASAVSSVAPTSTRSESPAPSAALSSRLASSSQPDTPTMKPIKVIPQSMPIPNHDYRSRSSGASRAARRPPPPKIELSLGKPEEQAPVFTRQTKKSKFQARTAAGSKKKDKKKDESPAAALKKENENETATATTHSVASSVIGEEDAVVTGSEAGCGSEAAVRPPTPPPSQPSVPSPSPSPSPSPAPPAATATDRLAAAASGSVTLSDLAELLSELSLPVPVESLSFFKNQPPPISTEPLGLNAVMLALGLSSVTDGGTFAANLPADSIDTAVQSFQDTLSLLAETIGSLLRLIPHSTWDEGVSFDAALRDMLDMGPESSDMFENGADSGSGEQSSVVALLGRRAKWMQAQLSRLEELHVSINNLAVRSTLVNNARGWGAGGVHVVRTVQYAPDPRPRPGQEGFGKVLSEDGSWRAMTVKELEAAVEKAKAEEAAVEHSLKEVAKANARSIAEHFSVEGAA